ncbi:SAM-dependent methyltransferase [Vibrio sonorensis]|uniref:SAM-dependent methyltransferase n=1 Tax=Vibrio sonorensis TaxID=1004316 RepID=UPI0008DA0E59|nr:SAM-dependent methyltransferase [Vibrio sonorensis]
MNIEPIGYVRNTDGKFQLELNQAYREGLESLTGFSHLQLIFWGHLADTHEYRSIVSLDKPYKNGPEKVGVFASRAPVRPNPILLSIAQVQNLDIEQGIIDLYWLDMEPDTPLLDIKPYHPCTDRVSQCQVPDWCSDWPNSYEKSGSFDWSKVFNF